MAADPECKAADEWAYITKNPQILKLSRHLSCCEETIRFLEGTHGVLWRGTWTTLLQAHPQLPAWLIKIICKIRWIADWDHGSAQLWEQTYRASEADALMRILSGTASGKSIQKVSVRDGCRRRVKDGCRSSKNFLEYKVTETYILIAVAPIKTEAVMPWSGLPSAVPWNSILKWTCQGHCRRRLQGKEQWVLCQHFDPWIAGCSNLCTSPAKQKAPEDEKHNLSSILWILYPS